MFRAKNLAYGLINCVGKHTVTGMIVSCGKLFQDWSADYKLFQGDRLKVDELFNVVRKELVDNQLSTERPVYAHMDDTLLKKTGKKVKGTAWRRDPLGPPFHTNFIWGQRFIQLSISLPEQEEGPSPACSIPIELFHCPTIKKPKKHEPKEVWDDFKEKQKQAKLSQQGVERLQVLRKKLDNDGANNRQLIVSVDGSYTNETVIKNLPERTTLIGRIRKDTSLFRLPEQNGKGRNRVYGEQLPTPEQIRQTDSYTWQDVKAYAAGKTHNFNIKVIKNIRWRKSGPQNLQLVIIRPLAYRLTKQSKLLYRQPAYLICTDPDLKIDVLLQAYLWRWGIEVNFREQKTLLGCGKSHVRTISPVEKLPAFITAIYAMIQLASHFKTADNKQQHLPRTKWYKHKKNKKATTGDIINSLRSQLYAKSLHINFSHFVNIQNNLRNQRNNVNPTSASLFYCRK